MREEPEQGKHIVVIAGKIENLVSHMRQTRQNKFLNVPLDSLACKKN
jgi:hypothetical protein